MAKDTVFKIILAVYVGLAVFRLTDPGLKWTKTKPRPGVVLPASIIPPSEIKIEKINLDLAISPSVVKDNEWEVFDDRAAWLATSSLPGKGNTIIYAHDRQGLFGSLDRLRKGDEIKIYVDKWLTYKVSEVKRVKPSDVEAILSDKNRLTLYTCDGAFDQKRLVVYAE